MKCIGLLLCLVLFGTLPAAASIPQQPSSPRQTVIREASPLIPTMVSFEQPTVSVLVPAMPAGTMLILREVAPSAVAPLLGANRLLGTPFEFWVEQNNVRMPELDTEMALDVRAPLGGILPSSVGLYHYNAAHGVWVRVFADFMAETSAFVGRFTGTGLFALLADTTPPAALAGISTQISGRSVTFWGAAEPLATLHLFAGKQFLGEFRADLRGQYRFPVTLPAGRHVLTLRQLDQAGNTSTQSAEVTITADWLIAVELTPGSRQVTVNRDVILLDVPPRIVNSRAMVPLRFLTEAVGAQVTWHEPTKTAAVVLGEIRVSLTIGSHTAIVNDQPVTLDVAPLVENGRTLVPVRFLAETFGFEVVWRSVTNTIELRK